MNRRVKHGSYVIIPLKYDGESFVEAALRERFSAVPITTMDINENARELFNHPDRAIGRCYQVPGDILLKDFRGLTSLRVRRGDAAFPFRIGDSYLYFFHTQVAFLCLQVTYDDMEAIYQIRNPGFADNPSEFSWQDGGGKSTVFSLEEWLDGFLRPLGLLKFFDGESTYLLDAYTYFLAVVPERFQTLEEMRQITFNLHQMISLDSLVEDESEDDIRYVYAVKTPSLGTYRWGCCIASQTISYVFADAEMDLGKQMEIQACDGLPVVLLSLYEKYTCLRFGQLITELNRREMQRIKSLKKQMLEFQAFGTITPANLSRWHNVKQTYACLLEVNDIETAVSDIGAKISILAEAQEEKERVRNETIINLITLFGIISILASVLDIIQILAGADAFIWGTTILTNITLLIILIMAFRTNK